MAGRYRVLALCLMGLSGPAQAQDKLLDAAEEELVRVWSQLSGRPEPAYWIGLGMTDYSSIQIQATNAFVAWIWMLL